MTFEQDAAKSIAAFNRFSAPALQKCFGNDAQIFSFENHNNRVEEILDTMASIDGIIAVEGVAYFYSSRVQFGTCYENFTLRGWRPSGATTEMAKLKRAAKIHAPMPTFTVQSFVDSDGLSATVGVAKTIDLIRYAENHNVEEKVTSTGERFFVIPWFELERVKVYRVDASGNVTEITATFTAA